MLQLHKVRQRFASPVLGDLPLAIKEQFSGIILPQGPIAIAVGSRGLAELPRLVALLVDYLRTRGCEPFLVPAMGSHGGGTAAGQLEVLQSLGIDENIAPIRASMETIELAAADGMQIYMDKCASEAAGIVLLNRIKAHTSFRASYESGLLKMAAVGLGKHKGALQVHAAGAAGLAERVEAAGRAVLDSGKIIAGVAVIENAREELAEFHVLTPQQILQQEPELLLRAKDLAPSLPFEDAGILFIDEIGKDLSGTGMDTNVVGRIRIPGVAEPLTPRLERIVVAGLSARSQGNAVGIGLADFTTERCFEQIDLQKSYVNALTSTFLERVKIPILCSSVAQAFAYAQETSLRPGVARIANTLHLEELYMCSHLIRFATRPLEFLETSVEQFDALGALKSW